MDVGEAVGGTRPSSIQHRDPGARCHGTREQVFAYHVQNVRQMNINKLSVK